MPKVRPALPNRSPSKREQKPNLYYGTAEFQAMTDLANSITGRGRVLGLAASLVRHPTLPRAMLAVRRLPAVEVILAQEEAARWRAPVFAPATRRIFEGRTAQAVLDIRDEDEEYLVGGRKEALRRNLRKARAEGIQVLSFDRYEEWLPAATEVLRAREGGPEVIALMRPPEPEQRMGYYAAVDREGNRAAFAGVAIFGSCGLLFSLLSHPDHPATAASRYLLHSVLRSDLRNHGVTHLIAGSALRDSRGNQLFQHLLGYDVRNLVLTLDLRESTPLPTADETGRAAPPPPTGPNAFRARSSSHR